MDDLSAVCELVASIRSNTFTSRLLQAQVDAQIRSGLMDGHSCGPIRINSLQFTQLEGDVIETKDSACRLASRICCCSDGARRSDNASARPSADIRRLRQKHFR